MAVAYGILIIRLLRALAHLDSQPLPDIMCRPAPWAGRIVQDLGVEACHRYQRGKYPKGEGIAVVLTTHYNRAIWFFAPIVAKSTYPISSARIVAITPAVK